MGSVICPLQFINPSKVHPMFEYTRNWGFWNVWTLRLWSKNTAVNKNLLKNNTEQALPRVLKKIRKKYFPTIFDNLVHKLLKIFIWIFLKTSVHYVICFWSILFMWNLPPILRLLIFRLNIWNFHRLFFFCIPLKMEEKSSSRRMCPCNIRKATLIPVNRILANHYKQLWKTTSRKEVTRIKFAKK